MFSFLRGSKPASIVAPEVGAQLTAASALPGEDAVDSALAARCRSGSVQGEPPQAVFNSPAREGEATAHVVASAGATPGLAVVNVPGERLRFDVWELSDDVPPKFERKRDLQLDAQQGSWVGYFAKDVGCLPQDRLIIAVNYYAPQIREALFIYDMKSGAASLLSAAAPHTDDYDRYFEIRPVDPDSALLLYYTGRQRTAPEVYHNAFSHVVLFSPRHPQGLEILKLGIDDGNVVEWRIADRKVWLRTLDRRARGKPVERFWSLDLQGVL